MASIFLQRLIDYTETARGHPLDPPVRVCDILECKAPENTAALLRALALISQDRGRCDQAVVVLRGGDCGGGGTGSTARALGHQTERAEAGAAAACAVGAALYQDVPSPPLYSDTDTATPDTARAAAEKAEGYNSAVQLRRGEHCGMLCEEGQVELMENAKSVQRFQLLCSCMPDYPIIVTVAPHAANAIVGRLRALGRSEAGRYYLSVTVFPHLYPSLSTDDECVITPSINFEPSGAEFGSHALDGLTVELPVLLCEEALERMLKMGREELLSHLAVYTGSMDVFPGGISGWSRYPDPLRFLRAGPGPSTGYVTVHVRHFSFFSVTCKIFPWLQEWWHIYLAMLKSDLNISGGKWYSVRYGFCSAKSWMERFHEIYLVEKRSVSLPVWRDPEFTFTFTTMSGGELSVFEGDRPTTTAPQSDLASASQMMHQSSSNVKSHCTIINLANSTELRVVLEKVEESCSGSNEESSTLPILTQTGSFSASCDEDDEKGSDGVGGLSSDSMSTGIDDISFEALIAQNPTSALVPHTEGLFSAGLRLMDGALNGENRVFAVKVFSTTDPRMQLEDVRRVMIHEIGILRTIKRKLSDTWSDRFMNIVSTADRDQCLRAFGVSIPRVCSGGIVTEWANAETLGAYLRGVGDPDFGPFLRCNPLALLILLYEIADGVRWLHGQDICHLDIKPDNIVLHRDFQKRNGRWYTSLCAKIIDFGCAVETDSAHEAETIGRLTGLSDAPGTAGYSVNNTLFNRHFKEDSAMCPEAKIAFLRYMDRHSLSVIFWAEDDDVLSCRNLVEPVYSSMSESELLGLQSKLTFGDRMNTPEVGCSLCRAAFATAEDLRTVAAALMSPTDVRDIYTEDLKTVAAALMSPTDVRGIRTVCESIATTIRDNSSVLRNHPENLFTIEERGPIELCVEQSAIHSHIRALAHGASCPCIR